MKVLIACEESQVVCKAFRERGHEAYSCDIQECSGGHPEWHIHGDVLAQLDKGWDMMIGHPPCTYLSNSGVRWLFDKKGFNILDRWYNLRMAIKFFNNIANANINMIAIENPIPHKYAKNGFIDPVTAEIINGIGKYNQLIQPWQFGHGETKATCLWLKNLPKLKATDIVSGREQRIWKMPPWPDRAKERSKTFRGIANAMAEQWG